jgi:hypothetical protein
MSNKWAVYTTSRLRFVILKLHVQRTMLCYWLEQQTSFVYSIGILISHACFNFEEFWRYYRSITRDHLEKCWILNKNI